MKLFIAGHNGMVGRALVRRYAAEPGVTLVLRTRQELDLTNGEEVEAFYTAEKPDAVIVAAAKVGGIHANATYPAEFLHDNLAIALNSIHGAHRAGVQRLLFLGSSCIYPKHAPQPMSENCLLTGSLEPTNEAYAIAKIAGMKLCQYYRKQYGVTYHSAMPTNLYGQGDNYHPQNSHVLPALIRRFHDAKTRRLPAVIAWGTGLVRREFMHVNDLADACAFLQKLPSPPDWVNVGTGADITIRELAGIVAAVTGYVGEIRWDTSKPDGTQRKLMDISQLTALGWRAQVSLAQGVAQTYAAFAQEEKAGQLRGL
ncbi:MAG: GDP-L-fucose synthase [Opitutaceae bacterium]|nr:GDP-L-fucose synthase [Opitutaceae bacterium]